MTFFFRRTTALLLAPIIGRLGLLFDKCHRHNNTLVYKTVDVVYCNLKADNYMLKHDIAYRRTI